MNNFEWLYENDKDTLVSLLFPCESKFCLPCDGEEYRGGCRLESTPYCEIKDLDMDNFVEWLMAEHESCNQDTDQAERENAELRERNAYLKHELATCRASCRKANLNVSKLEQLVRDMHHDCRSCVYPCSQWNVNQLHHVKPDPYKELLKEFAYRLCDMSVADGDLRRYADKFRELGKAGA